MRARLVRVVVAGLFVWIGAANGTLGQVTVVPPGLSPGASYRLVFVTSATRDATATDVGAYNAYVSAAANSQPLLAALGTTWKAVASTATIDAQDNTGMNPLPVGGTPTNPGVPIYRLDGLRVAPNNSHFWNMVHPENTISFTEFGTRTPISLQTPAMGEQPWVWTGSTSGGTKSPSNSLGTSFPVAAVAPNTSGGPYSWIGLATSAAGDSHALYGISGVLTIPGGFQAADFEEDHDVDASDLGQWKSNAIKVSGATHMQGDADADGDVDGSDFLVWQRQLGSSSAVPTGAVVPEPHAAVLLLIALAGLWRRFP